MIALVTGASSGIGHDIACYLSRRLGYDLIITARNKDKLRQLKNSLPTKVRIIAADLSRPEHAEKLYSICKGYKIDLLVNNAGFGIMGSFDKTSLESEKELINLNIYAVHALTKLFLKDFKLRNSGHILNVASSAGFYPGPLMSSYYASKAYVINLSRAVNQELKEEGSSVTISVLCPGPVETNFNKRAGAVNSFKPADSESVAKYAVDETLRGRFMIIPTFKMKIGIAAMSLVPDSVKSKIIYEIQKSKLNK